VTSIPDDYEVPRRSLEEIEAEANRLVGLAGFLPGDWIDPNEFMSSLKFKLLVKPASQMMGATSFASAKDNTISVTREMSKDLRYRNPKARYTWAHEVGHLALHRQPGLKARMAGAGNLYLASIKDDESAELQAWKFARAMFVNRTALLAEPSDQRLSSLLEIPAYAIELRRIEVASAIEQLSKRSAAKVVPQEVYKFLGRHRGPTNPTMSIKNATRGKESDWREVWSRAALIDGEDPNLFRSARGFRIAWDHRGHRLSHMGWAILNGEAVAYLDISSR
jgi:hypothetical protein